MMNSTRSKVLAVVLIGVGALVFFQKSKLFGVVNTLQDTTSAMTVDALKNSVNFIAALNSVSIGSGAAVDMANRYPALTDSNLKAIAARINTVIGSINPGTLPLSSLPNLNSAADFSRYTKGYFNNGIKALAVSFKAFDMSDILAGQNANFVSAFNALLTYLEVQDYMSITVPGRVNSSSVTMANQMPTKSPVQASSARKATTVKSSTAKF